MSNITAIDVSNFFTNKAIEQGNPLTAMQALKLTYIAQGFHLSLTTQPFFSEKIEAWKHGPVVRKLYQYLKARKDDNYMVTEKQDVKGNFNEKQIDILNVVFSKYGTLGAWTLSEITHKKGTPWRETYDKQKTVEIPIKVIEEHFKKTITPSSFAILLSSIN